MPSLSIKERKANTNDLIFRKKFNLPSGILLSADLLESRTNKYKLFGTKSKQTVNFPNTPKNLFFNTLKEIYNDRRT